MKRGPTVARVREEPWLTNRNRAMFRAQDHEILPFSHRYVATGHCSLEATRIFQRWVYDDENIPATPSPWNRGAVPLDR